MSDDNWVHRASNMRCRSCIYFVPKQTVATDTPREVVKIERQLGRCRRHSPTLGGWPAIFDNDWCGDHKLDENKI